MTRSTHRGSAERSLLIAYVDTSVLLRKLFGQPNAYRRWNEIRHPVGSDLVEVECRRTLDRHLVLGRITAMQAARKHDELAAALARFERVELNRPVLLRAAQPNPVPLSTLDSLHLATCVLWREHRDVDIVFLTHDNELARAARCWGLAVEE